MKDQDRPLRNWSDVGRCPKCGKDITGITRIKLDAPITIVTEAHYQAIPCGCMLAESEYQTWLSDKMPAAGPMRKS